jgi:aspartyl/asparaginyl-tRNA synthetase
MSRSRTGRKFANVEDLDSVYKAGDTVWLRGRLHSIRIKGGSCFLVLRQNSFNTVQACFFKGKENPEFSQKMIKYLKSLTVESIIDLEGTVEDAEVKSCSIQNVELKINRIHAVTKATPILPFLVEDASRSEAEVDASQETDRPFPRLGQELRLDHRWMDLRAPANNAIFRVQSMVCQLFRESLYSQGFTEIHSPKIIAGESESGAGVFTTDYFGTTACLAQSPQILIASLRLAPSFGQRILIHVGTCVSSLGWIWKCLLMITTWKLWKSFTACSVTFSRDLKRAWQRSWQSFVSSTLPSL